ncbi:MAG: bifunctional riboflavin kinase/FAD synthetase [Gammaproteobacteria bacterium]|nr:bifunctional riboflavin kinase/FAD synthetase [Gammaproteobacteria bacterium]
MRVIRGLDNLRPCSSGRVVTIGNFDGVHRGHQRILAELRALARRQDMQCLLVTFEPHPRELLRPEQAPARLTRLGEKLRLLRAEGLENVLVLRFDQSMARLDPERFVMEILVGALDTRHLLIGDDFHFGHRGLGNFELLRQLAERGNYALSRQSTVAMQCARVSSSRIRAALEDGDFDTAAELLGRDYSVSGRVTHGQRLGRTIGFPTANLPLRRRVSPLRGVFAVKVRIEGFDTVIPAVANVGSRPTVGGVDFRLEVHCFDIDADLYGRRLCVEPVHKIRDERKFESLDALKAQIAADAGTAREVLRARGFGC